jgi:hypothetical protein
LQALGWLLILANRYLTPLVEMVALKLNSENLSPTVRRMNLNENVRGTNGKRVAEQFMQSCSKLSINPVD